MTRKEAQKLAMSLPHAERNDHMGTDDMRVKNKIFCTFPEDGFLVLKLMPEQQALFLETNPSVFESVSGSWGQKGWTRLDYRNCSKAELFQALETAWKNVAQKRMLAAYEQEKSQ